MRCRLCGLFRYGGAFGGLAWPETDVADTDRATLIRHLLPGSNPVGTLASAPSCSAGRAGGIRDKLIADSPQRNERALRAACNSIQARIELWNGTLSTLRAARAA
jgi:hypothetical protein